MREEHLGPPRVVGMQDDGDGFGSADEFDGRDVWSARTLLVHGTIFEAPGSAERCRSMSRQGPPRSGDSVASR